MGKEEATLLIEKANECLKEAQALFDLGFYAGSVNRAYYSIFNAIQCVLQTKDILVKTHQGSHVQFSQYFIKTGIFSEEIRRIPQQVESLRLKGDYESGQQISKEDALEAIAMTRTFYSAIKHYFDTANKA